MKKKELVFILDCSGSMSGLEADTVGGFNSMISKQKKSEGEVRVTTVMFADSCHYLHDRLPLVEVKKMKVGDYQVGGCTALIDALGKTITAFEERCGQDTDVLMVITTDGQENASKHYCLKDVRKMIERNQERGWEFIFLGANMDAVAEAAAYGIRNDRAVRFANDSRGIGTNYEVMSEVLGCIINDEEIPEGWAEKIREDYRSR